MLRSILYVSQSALVFSNEQTQITDLVHQSRVWNQYVGITGALVFTERYFVQFIEGPNAAIGNLLGKLYADRRHSGIRVIQDVEAADRHFQDWDLAYSGPDAFIDSDLAALLQVATDTARLAVSVELRSRLHGMGGA
ncbi:MAG: hypothetical protein JWO15_950 [Sphingomonadales bacterium]|nr:hypothetical protein [Sphingomonadales bacterium]